MRYKTGHKEKVKEQILETAGKLLRKNSFAGIGIDGLMAELGMTSGAFYSNFASKEQLLEEVLERDLSRIRDYLRDKAEENKTGWLAEFAADYISSLHRMAEESTCTMPVLTPDLSRAGEGARRIYEARLTEIVAAMAQGTAGADEAERLGNAWRLLAAMVGAVLIARALPDGQAADEILTAGAAGAQQLSRAKLRKSNRE